LKKEHIGIIPRGAMVTGEYERCIFKLHQSDIPCSKGERLFRGRSKEFRQGEKPQGDFKQGEQPQEDNDPFPLMSKGER
jgi:hypothetical protein